MSSPSPRDAERAQYLDVPALKERLRAHGQRTAGTRAELLARCVERGLVTDRERLATRDPRKTRRAWLEHELALVGCELRADSRLCAEYVEGRAPPGMGARHVAAVMAEMKFFHEHTDYAAILDGLRDEARRDFEREQRERWGRYDGDDVRFRDFFDPQEASEEAKAEALNRYAASLVSLSSLPALMALPATLRHPVLVQATIARFDAWVRRVFGPAASFLALGAASRHIETDERLSVELLSDDVATDRYFHGRFHAKIEKAVKLEAARVRVGEFVGAALARAGLPNFGDVEASARALAGGFAPETIEAAVEALVEILEKAKGRPGREPDGRWRCSSCSYVGGTSGMRDHAKRHKHPDGGADARVPGRLKALAQEHEARVRAARTIQRAWRRAVACPDFAVCMRRLRREFDEGMG